MFFETTRIILCSDELCSTVAIVAMSKEDQFMQLVNKGHPSSLIIIMFFTLVVYLFKSLSYTVVAVPEQASLIKVNQVANTCDVPHTVPVNIYVLI